jgi:hypothetical protein
LTSLQQLRRLNGRQGQAEPGLFGADAHLLEAKVSEVEVKGAVVQHAYGAADDGYSKIHRKLGKTRHQLGANPLTVRHGAEKANPKKPLPLKEVQNTAGGSFPPREPNSPGSASPKEALQMLPHSSLDLLQ